MESYSHQKTGILKKICPLGRFVQTIHTYSVQCGTLYRNIIMVPQGPGAPKNRPVLNGNFNSVDVDINIFATSKRTKITKLFKLQNHILSVTRQKEGALGSALKGVAKHKLWIIISRIFQDQATDRKGETSAEGAIIKGKFRTKPCQQNASCLWEILSPRVSC